MGVPWMNGMVRKNASRAPQFMQLGLIVTDSVNTRQIKKLNHI